MGLPNIELIFKTKGISAIQRSQKGVVALIIKDENANGLHTLFGVRDIPTGISEGNKKFIERCFLGNMNVPRKVYVHIIPINSQNLNDAFDMLSLLKFDYLTGNPEIEAADVQTIASWIKSERQNGHLVKGVLPKSTSDHESIVNFTSEEIELIGDEMCTPSEYCSRIAGLIAGTPMTISCTYSPLPEVLDVKKYTREQLDTKIDKGEFIIFNDGEKVKVGRGVNSLQTTTQDKGDSFKKIKIVEAVDMMSYDIRVTCEDSYIGKYANSYDNKCLLITAIKGYFAQLETEGILDKGKTVVEIDMERQRNYLQSTGVDIETMSEQQIKEANTADKVFIKAEVKILDAIEDITMNISI